MKVPYLPMERCRVCGGWASPGRPDGVNRVCYAENCLENACPVTYNLPLF